MEAVPPLIPPRLSSITTELKPIRFNLITKTITCKLGLPLIKVLIDWLLDLSIKGPFINHAMLMEGGDKGFYKTIT